VVAFSREANNPDRPSDVDGIEHFMWYAFALLAALAITLMLLHVARKKITGLTLALVTTSITLLMAGAPANDSGHFVWRCSKEDYEPPGCQEASYDNHAMVFFVSFDLCGLHDDGRCRHTINAYHRAFYSQRWCRY